MTVLTWISGVALLLVYCYGFAVSNKDKKLSTQMIIETIFVFAFVFVLGRAVRIW